MKIPLRFQQQMLLITNWVVKSVRKEVINNNCSIVTRRNSLNGNDGFVSFISDSVGEKKRKQFHKFIALYVCARTRNFITRSRN